MNTCDLFCAVIDNFGDIGVCRRLALQLHRERGHAVRLWVDDLAAFTRLEPGLNPDCALQLLNGVEVRHWTERATDGVTPADIVIEGFGCRLPDNYLAAMAARSPQPVWINLEYLSAEPWTLGCHRLSSPHPRLPLRQTFWFPGFTPDSGGLIREAGLLAERDRFQADAVVRAGFWKRLGYPEAAVAGRRMSLFAYENPAAGNLLDALSSGVWGTDPVFVAVPEGRVLADVSVWAGRQLRAGDRVERGRLTVGVLPFLLPEDYDRLLWACDLNAVRGEDSFIRAHWAGTPLLWHIYRQEEDAHLVKLDAWLDLPDAAMPHLWRETHRRWNRPGDAPADWNAVFRDWDRIAARARAFSDRLAAQSSLADRLEDFCAGR